MAIVRKVYSQEMRDIFQKHREDGKSVAWISNALQIAIGTLQTWRAELKKKWTLKDKRFWNSTKQKKFSDEDLALYIDNNVNATLKDIWDHFSVSDVAILKRLRNMDYSYKKKRWGIKKGMKNIDRSSRSS